MVILEVLEKRASGHSGDRNKLSQSDRRIEMCVDIVDRAPNRAWPNRTTEAVQPIHKTVLLQ